ncbi:unnamed protein product [Triticum turgidum subsp. durum]|uniref:Uncharacterized protein n=1 Tax=Triticum turgidum subsp. durum TaxID=4567 RepID=A0A9R0YLV7_TRITD|nr:unnamed protein product [Triticum turgidum subsp. durum]
MKSAMDRPLLLAAIVVLIIIVPAAQADDGGCGSGKAGTNHRSANSLKIAAFFSILICGALGCGLPVMGRRVPWLNADADAFFLIKALAAGVILSTGFIHILPDAFEDLTSDCLPVSGPWKEFPFAGLGAMVGAIGALIFDTVATAYITRVQLIKGTAHAVACSGSVVGVDEENPAGAAGEGRHQEVEMHEGYVDLHTHASNGHAHGSAALVVAVGGSHDDKYTIRQRVISQVLELGIVVHSVIIGISLGACPDPDTIKPLVIALSFHQMFEGIGLGGCIVQAKFKATSLITMILFFCFTTPVSIGIGAAISSVYNENSPNALIMEGLLNSVAAGILVYMALVDLLAEELTNPKVQGRWKLQLGIYIFMLIGAGLMSMLAKWA